MSKGLSLGERALERPPPHEMDDKQRGLTSEGSDPAVFAYVGGTPVIGSRAPDQPLAERLPTWIPREGREELLLAMTGGDDENLLPFTAIYDGVPPRETIVVWAGRISSFYLGVQAYAEFPETSTFYEGVGLRGIQVRAAVQSAIWWNRAMQNYVFSEGLSPEQARVRVRAVAEKRVLLALQAALEMIDLAGGVLEFAATLASRGSRVTKPRRTPPARGVDFVEGMQQLGVKSPLKRGDLLEMEQHVRRSIPDYRSFDTVNSKGKRVKGHVGLDGTQEHGREIYQITHSASLDGYFTKFVESMGCYTNLARVNRYIAGISSLASSGKLVFKSPNLEDQLVEVVERFRFVVPTDERANVVASLEVRLRATDDLMELFDVEHVQRWLEAIPEANRVDALLHKIRGIDIHWDDILAALNQSARGQ